MGCEVVVGGATGVEEAAVERLFETLEASLSRFRPDSDLERGIRRATLFESAKARDSEPPAAAF